VSSGGPLIQHPHLTTAVSGPSGFRWGEVRPTPRAVAASTPQPPLGPLAAFAGDWAGTGFNSIFRPNSPQTPTTLTTPAGGDNILELNLTAETLSFSSSLGSVPNRGMVDADAFLNGVPYLQVVNDITAGSPVGIHLEPGVWLAVPTTGAPAEGPTVARMASIPHGTTVLAQGSSQTTAGEPTIPSVDMTPFSAIAAGQTPSGKTSFASQTAAAQGTARIPQDLTSFVAAGTIIQEMLDDPNSLLRDHLSGLTITETTQISISTCPSSPLFGGGVANIAFLTGNPGALANPVPTGQNAQTLQMTATFWIETVQHTLLVPPVPPGHPALILAPETATSNRPTPTFSVSPPAPTTEPQTINVTSTQIQYSQEVLLNFNTLTWPHVSVATLVPASPIPVPPVAWT
jgi:hypothetical protein